MNALRPFISYILAPFLTAIAGWLMVNFGIEITNQQIHDIAEKLATYVFPLLMMANGVIRTLINRKTNPANAATSHLAEEGVVKQDALKAQDANLRNR